MGLVQIVFNHNAEVGNHNQPAVLPAVSVFSVITANFYQKNAFLVPEIFVQIQSGIIRLSGMFHIDFQRFFKNLRNIVFVKIIIDKIRMGKIAGSLRRQMIQIRSVYSGNRGSEFADTP